MSGNVLFFDFSKNLYLPFNSCYTNIGENMNENQREILLKHYQNPYHKGLINDETYEQADMNNESCIDEVTVQAKIENNQIKDLHFDGEACAICTSSASIMVKTLENKTIEQAKEIYKNFENMVNGEPFDKEILEETSIYQEIGKQPSRKKCVSLPWWAIQKILNQKDTNKEKI